MTIWTMLRTLRKYSSWQMLVSMKFTFKEILIMCCIFSMIKINCFFDFLELLFRMELREFP